MLLIPTADLPHYFETTELDGRVFGLEFYWNTRDLAWFLTIWDPAFETPLLSGRKVVVDGQLIGRFARNGKLPPGEITATDLGGTKAEPSYRELGQRVLMSYLEAAEIT